MKPFVLLPAIGESPLVVEVPHAGLKVPAEFVAPLCADQATRRRDADLFIDGMWTAAPQCGAPLLVAKNSRYVCDLNRDVDDVDRESVPDHPSPRADAPRGFVWRIATDGRPVQSRPLTLAEWQKRVEKVWEPYHRQLEALLSSAVSRFGFSILVSGHSMPSVGNVSHSDSGQRRAEIVLGWRGGDSCSRRLLDACEGHFASRGFSVRVDDPYRGGATTGRYGKPAQNRHAIQIEISRALYMNEETCVLRAHDMNRLQKAGRELLENLGKLELA